MTRLMEEHPLHPGEDFSERWDRLWHEDKLPDSAYGHKSVIARIRRGKWVFIPPAWRGVKPDKSTIRKRQSKHPRKERRKRNKHYTPTVEEFDE